MIESWKLLCILGSLGCLILWCCFNVCNKKRRLEQHNLAVVVVRPTAAPCTEVTPSPREDLPPPYEAAVKMPPPPYNAACQNFSYPPPPSVPQQRPVGTS